MPVSLAVRALTIVVFVTAGGYCVLRCVVPGAWRPKHRFSHLLSECAHLGMSVAMVAMVWRPAGDRWGLQLTFFAIACGWFLVGAVRPGFATARLGLLHRAVAMAAMFWMVMRLPLWSASSGSVRGMSMPGLPGAEAAGPASVATLTFAGYLAVAALWWLGRWRVLVLRPSLVGATAPGRAGTRTGISVIVLSPAGEAGCQAAMAAAMTVLLVAMA